MQQSLELEGATSENDHDDNTAENDANYKWRDFYQSTTLHGFRFIFDETGIKRILWIVIFFAGIIAACYLFFGVINDFSKLKTITMAKESFTNKGSMFPTVTLCNYNGISTKAIENHPQFNKIWDVYHEFITTKNESDNSTNFTDRLKNIQKLLNVTSMRDFLEKFEMSLEDMMDDKIVATILSDDPPCKFEHEICNSLWFRKVFTEKYGLCHELNYYEIGHPTKTLHGVESSFNIFLNVHADKVAFDRRHFNGIAVRIHPYGTPAASHYSQEIVLSPGTINSVGLTLTQLTLLPPPYESRCGKLNYTFINQSYPYSKPMCELDCAAADVLKTTGCLGYSFEHLVDTKYMCTPEQYMRSKIETRIFDDYQENCREDCPYECSFMRYEATSTETVIGTKDLIDRVAKEMKTNHSAAQDYIRDNIIGLSIKFSKTSTTDTTVVPTVTSVTMLGSIGGNFGLCLGFSFMTFFEFLFYFVGVCIKKGWFGKKCEEKFSKTDEINK